MRWPWQRPVLEHFERRQQYPSTPEEAERALNGHRVEYMVADEVRSMSTEELLSLPLNLRVEKCLELGYRSVPVDQAEKEAQQRTVRPGLVVYADTPVKTPMTAEVLAEMAKPHKPREGEVTPEHIQAWLEEKPS